jgi:NodT family efflux transporter outer membrane factor (OMF) lipoprotein
MQSEAASTVRAAVVSTCRRGPDRRRAAVRLAITPHPLLLILFIAALPAFGCTSLHEYVHNGFKVGPNYKKPPAPVAPEWIDAADVRVRKESDDLSQWWKVFNDPALDSLICTAYRQNLTLREAGYRVLQARAQLGIAVGYLFPQVQSATANYNRNMLSLETANSIPTLGPGKTQRFYDQFDRGFNLSWEIDFWGRFRRAVEADAASLDASVEDYDDVLVTLLGDIATNYVQLRTFELRLKYTRDNVQIQRDTLKIVDSRFKVGTTTKLDVAQAKSTLEQTEAQVPELEIGLRQTSNRLCILLGIPPEELRAKLGAAPIPTAPIEVAAGIPADLLRRRPDVRRAERKAAAQSAEIGIAESEFYPHIAINGTLDWSAQHIYHLWRSTAMQGTVGPTFTWNILNYGRIANNVLVEKAKFQEIVTRYQNTVLDAAREVEDGLVTFLKAQQREKTQQASVDDADEAVRISIEQYKTGTVDFTRVTQLQTTLVLLQDTLAQAQGEIATGLIQVYRGLGGGWQIRLDGCDGCPAPIAGFGTPSAIAGE